MAFNKANLASIGHKSGWNQYYYDAGSDTMATVNTAGYFNNVDDNVDINVGDVIIVKATDQVATLLVSAISSGSVTTDYMVPRSPGLVAGGAALTLTRAAHDGKTILWDTAAGTVLTLPAATGTGMKIRCVVSILCTSNSHILAAAGSDMMQGACGIVDTDTSDATIQFAALVGDTFDKVTMNRTTSGLGAPGDWVEVEDVVSGVWSVKGVIRASGTVVTPFSST